MAACSTPTRGRPGANKEACAPVAAARVRVKTAATCGSSTALNAAARSSASTNTARRRAAAEKSDHSMPQAQSR